jgi:hypothetical protein
MSDYQQTVDRVRAFVAGADQTRTDDLADLASAYAEQCRDANARLRRCVDFLRRGLRSEAIQLAENQPNLLDLVATLDISEIDEWEQICAAYDLARPMRMMIAAAQELNEAYAQEKPLQSLLSEHRLLALGRAPLSHRLEVIRDLAVADPANSCWAEDQKVFEDARLRELRGEVTSVVRSRNVDSIDLLTSELTQQKWLADVPADLKDFLSKGWLSVHGEKAIGELKQMAGETRVARQSGDYPLAKKQLAKWDKKVADYKVQQPKDLQDELASLRKWVADHEALQVLQASFQTACADLRAVLDSSVPEEIFVPRYNAVRELGLPIPDDLEREYRALKRKFDRSRRFEQFGVFLLVAVVAVAILGGVAYAIWRTAHSGGH